MPFSQLPSTATHCPKCSTALELHSRFCGVCGHRLELAQPAAAKVPDTEAAGKAQAMPSSVFGDSASSETPQGGLDLFSGQDPYLGQTLNNRFVVESKLGEGGFGAVYKGTQKGTNRAVALKVLHPEMTHDENTMQRFRREGQVLCRLRDAHTVTTYDFDQTPDGLLYIAMELLEGPSLHDIFTREAPIHWQRVLKILSQMCSSLAEAHALGVVHRDLKPENIHLEQRPGDNEFVKILDFGIAKMRGSALGNGELKLTATGQTLGTLEYMSPEQLMGKELDGRSDIYGLGVLAYELITGQLPFPDAVGPAMLISAQLKTIAPMPSEVLPSGEIPPAVDVMIMQMLGKTADRRQADVGVLREECLQLLGTMHSYNGLPVDSVRGPAPKSQSAELLPPVSAAPYTPGPSTQAILKATGRRGRWIWVFGVIAVLGLAAVAVYWGR